MASGQPVSVDAETTESSQTVANPDGTFTMDTSVEPVRVNHAGTWVPIDTTLHVQPDGSIAPAAVTTTESFSGGGDGPLVRIEQTGKSLSLGLPVHLPLPTLSGDTATYADVPIPGVDLQVTARSAGFSTMFVVKTAQAAKDPALTKLTFTTQMTGVTLSADGAGNVQAVDGGGTPIFLAPTPHMWSSPGSGQAASSVRAATAEPADGSADAALGVAVTSAGLTLSPDQSMLTNSTTHFPVYIDPSWSDPWTPTDAKLNEWVRIDKAEGFVDWEPSGNDAIKVGHYYDWPGSPSVDTYRDYFEWNISQVAGKNVGSVTFQTFETAASNCTPQEVDLGWTGSIPSSPGWGDQPGWLKTLASQTVAKGGFVGSCDQGEVNFSDSRLDSELQTLADSSTKTLTLGFKAPDESGQTYKYFKSGFKLEINYNTRPTQVTADDVSLSPSVPCRPGADPVYIDSATPTMSTRLKDPDGGQLKGHFNLYRWSDTTQIDDYTTGVQDAGTTFSRQIPAGKLADGTEYAWQVRGEDHINNGWWGPAWSTTPWGCAFIVDITKPKVPAVDTSFTPTYSQGQTGGGIGTDLKVRFTANGSDDVVHYLYGLNDDQPQQATAVAPDGGTMSGTFTADVPIHSFGPQALYVWAQDRAGNISPGPYTYKFTVAGGAPETPAAYWGFNDPADTGTTGHDASGNGHDLTLTGPGLITSPGAQNKIRPLDNGLSLNTTSQSQAQYGATSDSAAKGPIIDTSQSFTVSAWVYLTSTTNNATAVSIDGHTTSAFNLGYATWAKSWTFYMKSTDVASPSFMSVVDPTPPQLNQWVFLSAVYDAPAETLTLYVSDKTHNPAAVATLSNVTTTWSATGNVYVGAAQWNGARVDYWTTGIDEVRLYSGALTADQIQQIARD